MAGIVRSAGTRSFLCAVVVWLPAVVVPLQCATTLRDFRRALNAEPAAPTQANQVPALATLLHGHSHAQRHHHTKATTAPGVSSGAFGGLLPLARAWFGF